MPQSQQHVLHCKPEEAKQPRWSAMDSDDEDVEWRTRFSALVASTEDSAGSSAASTGNSQHDAATSTWLMQNILHVLQLPSESPDMAW